MAGASLLRSATHWRGVGCDLVRRAGRWWLREFLALFPARAADWLMDRGCKRLVLSAHDDGVAFELSTEGRRPLASVRISLADYSADLIDGFLQAQRLGRRDVSVGVRLRAEHVFARTLLLPIETERTLGTVLASDLLAKTPLRLDDVYHDHSARRAGNTLHVRHWVVKRAFVGNMAEALGLQLSEVAFVEAPGTADEPDPHVRLQRAPGGDGHWARRTLVALSASACLLALLAVGLKYRAQQQTLAALAVELKVARAKAQRVRTVMDQLQAERAALLKLRASKQAPNLLDIWEEVTRVLPSHAWLTEMRLSELSPGGDLQVVISGLSPAAASLVGLVDRSPLFRDAALIAPVSLDVTEGKERFAIQARLKPADPLRTAAR